MDNQTKAIDTPFGRRDAYGALSMPVYHTAAYEFDTAADMADAFTGRVLAPDYSRVMNPTVTFLEDKVRNITNAHAVVAMSSGMAAISATMLALSAQGKNIVTSRHMFGNSFSLITSSLPRFGVEARTCDLLDLEAVERNVDDNTCCIFLEIITNPQLEVADLSALAAIAHRHGIPLVADTTVIPSVLVACTWCGYRDCVKHQISLRWSHVAWRTCHLLRYGEGVCQQDEERDALQFRCLYDTACGIYAVART